MIAVTLFKGNGGTGEGIFNATVMFPIVLAACGFVGCLVGLGIANFKKMSDNPSRELDLSTWISAGLTVILGGAACYLIFGRLDAGELYSDFKIPPSWASSPAWRSA